MADNAARCPAVDSKGGIRMRDLKAPRFLMMLVLSGVTVVATGQECATSDCHGDLLKQKVVHTAIEDDCTTCHEGDDSHDFPAFPDPISELCFMCHDDVTTGGNVHMALDMDGCLGCHNPHGGNYEKLLNEAIPGLCFNCHDDNASGEHVHAALDMDGCTGCHTPHSGDNAALLMEPMPVLCYQCHDGDMFAGKFIHGPVGAGECTTCHSPHSTANPTLLTSPQPGLCTECHPDQDFSDGSGKMHTALGDGCTGCHSPHASANEMQLMEPKNEMCAMCHGTADEALELAVPHGPVIEEGGCFQCHAPHGSAHGNNLEKGQPDLCVGCHDGSKVDGLNMSGLLKASSILHSPVGDGECTACHGQHGSDNAAMLTAAYPDKFYTPYGEEAYELCFMCHDASAFDELESEDTGFRHGNRNLHYLHVNKGKGRTCRACHDVHGTMKEHLVRETVTFGKWQLPVGFQPTDGGGTCNAGCHKPYSYDRGVAESK